MVIFTHEESHFLREGVVDINAAVVGVSKNRWIFIEKSSATEENAKAIMYQERFDVLPIVKENEIKKYFRTLEWGNYSKISLEKITYKDVIPFHTHISDVIKGFALESRNFYFLRNERRIVGLISIVNLNCRQVKVYLFSLLSELEVSLGKFISAHVSDDELLQMMFSEKDKEKHEDLKKRYQEDKNLGVDAPFVEYLYLSDLINIISKKKLHKTLGYDSCRCFKKSLGSLNDLRNIVAHPTRSIIRDDRSVMKLWERIERVEEVLFLLG